MVEGKILSRAVMFHRGEEPLQGSWEGAIPSQSINQTQLNKQGGKKRGI